MFRLENVSKKYENGVLALNNVDLRVKEGEFVFLVWPSGAGKSTILKLLSKEEIATHGDVYFKNRNITSMKRREIPFHRRQLGIVFQDYRLLENKTVYENVAYALEIIGASSSDIKREVPRVLSLVKLSHKSKSYPSELSGGEAQRVAIARSVVNKPKLVLADEPTGNLDIDTSMEIMDVLMDINASGTTVLMATHAKYIVDAYKKRVVTISNGKIISDKVGGYSV